MYMHIYIYTSEDLRVLHIYVCISGDFQMSNMYIYISADLLQVVFIYIYIHNWSYASFICVYIYI